MKFHMGRQFRLLLMRKPFVWSDNSRMHNNCEISERSRRSYLGSWDDLAFCALRDNSYEMISGSGQANPTAARVYEVSARYRLCIHPSGHSKSWILVMFIDHNLSRTRTGQASLVTQQCLELIFLLKHWRWGFPHLTVALDHQIKQPLRLNTTE